MDTQTGKYIVIEGLEGAGKTTAIEDIKKCLNTLGVKYVVVQEPGSTELGQSLRKIVKEAEYPIDPVAEAMLFAAARRQLWKERVEPLLASGVTVISDRGLLSTYAYQGGGRGLFEQVLDLAAITFDQVGFVYDLVVFLDVDPEVGLQRARQRSALDRIEREPIEFFNKAREHFLDLWEDTQIAKYTRHAVRIDANQTPHAVSAEIDRALLELIRAKED